MNDKTLFVSDMDGTLLLPDKTIGAYTARVLNAAAARGALFAVATARSAATVAPMLADVRMNAPAVLLNGTCIFDLGEQRYLDAQYFAPDVADRLLRGFEAGRRNVFVLTLPHLDRAGGHGNEIVCYYRSLDTDFERAFFDEREPMGTFKRFERVASYDEVPRGRVIYFSMTGSPDEMAALEADARRLPGLGTALYVDRYVESTFFFEIYPDTSSKRAGVERLARLTGAAHIVSFGDNTNDLGMFALSDECYAVANAIPDAAAAATASIGANTDEGVALFLDGRLGLGVR